MKIIIKFKIPKINFIIKKNLKLFFKILKYWHFKDNVQLRRRLFRK